ncbi:hypothetical protein D3C87_2026230 [compost metagenome]
MVVLMPMDSAAISFSRMAIQARPWVERTKFWITITVMTVKKNTHPQVVLAGMPLKPDAPPTYSVFSKAIRIISPRPRVAMAR